MMSSSMAGGRDGAALWLLLLITGAGAFSVSHVTVLEAVEGQTASLPCVLEEPGDLKVVSSEWSKKGDVAQKLVLFAPMHGFHYFIPRVGLEVVRNPEGQFVGSHLQLPAVVVKDAGVYVCDLATFPNGSLRTETELRVRELVTPSSSTPDDIIAVPTTDTPTSNVTQGAEGSTSDPVRGATSDGGNVSRVTREVEPVSAGAGPNSTVAGDTWNYTTAESDHTSHRPGSSPAPGPGSSPAPGPKSSPAPGPGSSPAPRPGSSPAPGPGSESTKARTEGATPDGAAGFRPTTWSRATVKTEDKGEAGSDWLLLLVLIPVLVSMAVAGVICRRRVQRQRLERPPTFKPPPPPVRYAPVEAEPLRWQTFPVSKCNSLQNQV